MKTSSIRTLVMAAFVTTTLGVTGFAFAQGHMPGEGAKMEGMHGNGNAGPMMNAAQNLSPEQQEIARKLQEEFFATTDAQRKQLVSKHTELMAQMNNASPDAAKIEALSKEIGALNGKVMSERAKTNSKLVKAGISPTGHGQMGGDPMGGGMKGGMQGQGCMMMKGMSSMNHGAPSEGQAPHQPAQGQHNQPGHSM